MTTTIDPGSAGLPTVSFIVPVRNDAERLRRCLASIRRQRPDAQLIVADNGSIDDSREVARSFDAVVLQLPGETVSVLRNRAAALATGEFLAFVDADIQLAPGWLGTALSSFSSDTVGAVGAEYSAPPDPNWLQVLYDGMREHPAGVTDARWLPAGNMVVRRSAFARVGGFEARLRTCEDVAFCASLKRSNYTVLTDARLRSPHFGDPATLVLLFRSEVWRARDNLRVSLRYIGCWRDLPSIVMPVLWLALAVGAAGMLIAAIASGSAIGLWTLLALALLLALSSLRALIIWTRIRGRHPRMFAGALAVAVVYDAARALALVVAVPHRNAGLRTASVEEGA
jgi:glycosyltransferase involved in cell wall biosynthesis